MRYKFLMNFFCLKSNVAPFSIDCSKLFITTLCVFFFMLTNSVNGQKISLDIKNKTVQQVFKEIENKSSYSFIYAKVQVEKIKPIDLKVENLDIAEVLDALLKNTPLGYTISGKNIIIKEKTTTNNNSEPPGKPFLVTGLVTDEKGKPLEGASVLLIASAKGTQTDKDGRFSISIPSKGGTLFFSFVAFEQTDIKVSKATDLTIRLNPKLEVKAEEVVVIGYGTVKKSDLTGAVSRLKTEGTEEKPITSVEQLIQGRVSGVQIQSANGAPGSGLSFLIRGGNSTSSNQPLIVLDGYPIDAGNGNLQTGGNNQAVTTPPTNPLANLNPSEIENIEILKDASSTAIYGSRGANGVVLITTKRGKKGNDRVDFNYRTDANNVIKKIKVLNSGDFLHYANEGAKNSGLPAAYSASQIAIDSPINNNWQNAIFRQGISNEYQIGISGGEGKTNYAINANYSTMDGIVRNSNFTKGGVRLNIDREVTSNLKIGMNVNITKSKQRAGVNGITTGLTSSNVIASSLLSLPFFEPYDSTGAIDQTFDANPLTLVNLLQDYYSNTVVLSNITAKLKLNNDFALNLNLGGNTSQSMRQTYYPVGTFVGTTSNGYAYKNQDSRFNYLGEFTLNYTKKIGQSNINAVVGHTYQKWFTDGFSTSAIGFPNDNLGFYGFQNARSNSYTYSPHQEWALASFLGRVNYSFKSKYLFTLTGRSDGASRLADGHKWAFFPSAALAWNISKEHFMQSVNWLSNWKLRASYGLSGNQSIDIGATSPLMTTDATVIGGRIVRGYIASNIANPLLGWENTRQLNLGTEFSILKNRITLEVNVYQKKTKDLLIRLPVTYVSGFNYIITNAGQVENKGIEFDLNAIVTDKKLKWTFSGNISVNRNKMTDMGSLGSDGQIFGDKYLSSGSNLLGAPIHVTELGYPIGSFYGYKIKGIYQNAIEVANGPEKSTAKPGDFKFVDLNADGKISDSDRTILGNPYPKFIFGVTNDFKYGNFTLSIFIQGSIGNQIANLNRYRLDALTATPGSLTNVSQAAYDGRWTGEGTSNYYPRARANGAYFNQRFTDFIIEDGSFIRLKNVTFGYNIPLKIVKFIKSARVFISATNVATITKYTGYDPEVNTNYNNPLTPGVDNGTYPQVRTFSIGANLKL